MLLSRVPLALKFGRISQNARSVSTLSPVWHHPAQPSSIATGTISTSNVANDIARLRHERPLHWTVSRLAKRFSMTRSAVSKMAPSVKYMRQTSIDVTNARRAAKTQTPKAERQQRLHSWWKRQFDDIHKHKQIRRKWRLAATKPMQEVDHDFRLQITARDSRADARAEKVKLQRKQDRLANKKR